MRMAKVLKMPLEQSHFSLHNARILGIICENMPPGSFPNLSLILILIQNLNQYIIKKTTISLKMKFLTNIHILTLNYLDLPMELHEIICDFHHCKICYSVFGTTNEYGHHNKTVHRMAKQIIINNMSTKEKNILNSKILQVIQN